MVREEAVRATLTVDLGPGRIRRCLLGIALSCLILAGCPVWPSAQIAFSRSYRDGGEWVVEFQCWGETYHVRTPDRDAMRILDAILWERSRR